MQNAHATSPDKIIVDRRRSTRNADVRRAIKNTRERLTVSGNSHLTFDREMLFRHADALASGGAAMPILIILSALASLIIGFGVEAFVWAIGANLAYLGLILVAKRLSEKKEQKKFNLRKWSIVLLIAHAVVGLSWAAFTMLQCHDCDPGTVPVYKAMTLLIAIATSATIGYNLRWSTPFAFAVPVLVFAGMHLFSQNQQWQMLAIMMIAALTFFTYIAVRLNSASQSSITFQSKSNALFAELEMARSISEEARRRAEEANMAKSRFLASMSHELRTPLNAILGFSEVMSNEVLGPIGNDNYREYAKDILGSGQHLLNLINEILDLSRIEAGKYEMRNEAVRLDDIALDCIGLLRIKSSEKQITVNKKFEPSLTKIMADERAMRQVLLNLLSNAVKFTPRGGEITVKVGWTANGGQYISVKDNGPGIPEEEIPVVLSAFGQGSIAIKSAEQGTGLGLPIVQALIAMHGGRFQLKSELRHGTETIAILPPSRIMEVLPAEPEPQALNTDPIQKSA